MYYSATPDVCDDPERGHCLAVATSTSPAGPFVDMGMPLLLGMGFEYIDPMAFDDPVSGQALPLLGVGFQPIKVQELSRRPEVVCARVASRPTSSGPIRSRAHFRRLVEAAWVIRHDDFYYLFYSGDNCCGPDAEYGVMVARSTSPTGPFETLEEARGVPHSLMLFKSERWLAPGHNSIVTDKAGRRWMIYHAIDVNCPRQRQEDEINSRRILLIDRIHWRDGWPFVGTPSEESQASCRSPRASGCPTTFRTAGTQPKCARCACNSSYSRSIDMAAAVRRDGRQAGRLRRGASCPSRDRR